MPWVLRCVIRTASVDKAAFRLACRSRHYRFDTDSDICTINTQVPLVAGGRLSSVPAINWYSDPAALPKAADRRYLNFNQLGIDAVRQRQWHQCITSAVAATSGERQANLKPAQVQKADVGAHLCYCFGEGPGGRQGLLDVMKAWTHFP